MGAVMLLELDALNERRGTLVARYRDRLDRIEGVTMPFESRPAGERSAHHLAEVVLAEGRDRDRLAGALRDAGVQTSVHYPPTHRFSAYAEARADVARTDELAPGLLTLPLFPHLEPGQVDLVCDLLESALEP
jgi:dTDP-4-amino-4,6-dideoxygalactose transaminase